MAGTATVTERNLGTVRKIVWDWTSDNGSPSTGDATKQTDKYYDGEIIAVAQLPNTGGTQPTNLYDVTITDEEGHDVILGLGANLVNTGPTYKAKKDGLGAVATSKLTLNVTNAGAAKTGTVIVWLR